jgi:periplasmic protein TonB
MSVPDFDDIVFEKLNKEYGAYFLRKKYNRVLLISLVSAVIIGCLAVLMPFIHRPEQKKKEIYSTRYVSMENMMAPPGQPGSPPPVVPAAPALVKAPAKLKAAEAKYVAPKVVDSVPPVLKQIDLRSDSISGMSETGDINGSGDEKGSSGGVIGGTGTGGNGGGGGSGLYTTVDEMPKFRGGDINKFREWVQKKTKYPDEATINGIHGKVYVTFIVERDGTVSNGKVVKGVDPLIDNEALKAVMSSPKWSPGRLRGESVRVSYIIMLNFQL